MKCVDHTYFYANHTQFNAGQHFDPQSLSLHGLAMQRKHGTCSYYMYALCTGLFNQLTVHTHSEKYEAHQNHLRSRLSHTSLGRLMRIAIEGPQLSTVDYD